MSTIPITGDSCILEIVELNQQLDDYTKKIDESYKIEIDKEKLYKESKQLFENKYYNIMLRLKATNEKKTQTDLKASAIIGSHQERMDMIVAESAYHKAKANTKNLENEFKSLQERCYNFRAQLKRFGG
jgi:hypothetical protein